MRKSTSKVFGDLDLSGPPPYSDLQCFISSKLYVGSNYGDLRHPEEHVVNAENRLGLDPTVRLVICKPTGTPTQLGGGETVVSGMMLSARTVVSPLLFQRSHYLH